MMKLRRQGAIGERESRTQGASVAALRACPRTNYRAAQCVLMAVASSFGSLLALPLLVTRVLADDQHHAAPPHYLALLAHRFDRRPYFHL